MRTAERVVAEDAEEVLEELYRGLAAEVNHANRYLALSRFATEAGLPQAAGDLARAAEEEWRHVSALMERVTELGGDLRSRPLEVAGSEVLSRTLHPSGRSDPASRLRALLVASVEEDRSTVRFYADLCDKTWDGDPATAELALRSLIEESDAEDHFKRLVADWADGR